MKISFNIDKISTNWSQMNLLWFWIWGFVPRAIYNHYQKYHIESRNTPYVETRNSSVGYTRISVSEIVKNNSSKTRIFTEQVLVPFIKKWKDKYYNWHHNYTIQFGLVVRVLASQVKGLSFETCLQPAFYFLYLIKRFRNRLNNHHLWNISSF